jgi:hypothetical protein
MFAPLFKAKLWKLKADGDRKNPEDWFEREMWIAKNGSMVYYSPKEDRELVYYTSADVARATVTAINDGETCRTFVFQVQLPPAGAIIYINKNRDHGGISEELRTIERSRSSAETSPRPMDTKDYGIGAQIIRQLGIRKLNVLTDTDRPLGNIGYGLEIARLSKLK